MEVPNPQVLITNPWQVNTNPVKVLQLCPNCGKVLGGLQVLTGAVDPWSYSRRFQQVSDLA
jgi:hypothetical protein